MGYWAKDGAYVHDDADVSAMEAMNETQGQAYDRLSHAAIESKPLFTEKEQEAREREYARRVEERAKFYEGNREYRRQQESMKEEERIRQARREAYENAKARFNRLSAIKKTWLNLTGNGIGAYNALKDVEVLDSLYRGKSR